MDPRTSALGCVRVAIDCRYIRERPSGIGGYVQALIDRLPALSPGDLFHLWADPRAKRPLSTCSNVRHTVVRAQANSIPTLLWPARLAKLSDVHVFHAPSNILGRGVPCASVVTVHDLIWVLDPLASEGLNWLSPIQIPYYRDGILRALRSATRIVAISEATAASIASAVPHARPRIRVIPHGVDARFCPAPDEARARADAARVLGSDEPYFLVIGQNAPFKNHAQIIEAFAASGAGKRARLVLVQRLFAGGSLHKRAKELGVLASTRFLSSVSSDELIALIRGALALIQFSRYEGFGMPVVEAMACGTSVIASDIPALREILGGAGLVVRLDVGELARAITTIERDAGLRAELSGRGLARARDFSWDRSAAAHLDVYREAAREG